MVECVKLADEREFLAVFMLLLACVLCTLCGMIAIVGVQIKRLAELLRVAREAAQSESNTGLLSAVTGRLAPKKKKTAFEDTSCAGARDLDEEEI